MTLKQFEEIHRRLDEAGEEKNAHRIHHSCFGEDGDLVTPGVGEFGKAVGQEHYRCASVARLGHSQPHTIGLY